MTTPTAFKEHLLSEVLDYQRSLSHGEVSSSASKKQSGGARKGSIGIGIAAAALVGAVAVGGFGSATPAAAADAKAVAAVNDAVNSKILHLTYDFGEKTEVFTDRSDSGYATLTRFLNQDGSVRHQIAFREVDNHSSVRVLNMETKQYHDTVIEGQSATESASGWDDSGNIKSLINDGVMKQTGKEKVNGKDVLRLTGLEGKLTMFVDADTYLPVRVLDATGSKTVTFDYEWIDRNSSGTPALFPEIPAGFKELDISNRNVEGPQGEVPLIADTPPVTPLDGSVFYAPQLSTTNPSDLKAGEQAPTPIDGGALLEAPPIGADQAPAGVNDASATAVLPPTGRQ